MRGRARTKCFSTPFPAPSAQPPSAFFNFLQRVGAPLSAPTQRRLLFLAAIAAAFGAAFLFIGFAARLAGVSRGQGAKSKRGQQAEQCEGFYGDHLLGRISNTKKMSKRRGASTQTQRGMLRYQRGRNRGGGGNDETANRSLELHLGSCHKKQRQQNRRGGCRECSCRTGEHIPAGAGSIIRRKRHGIAAAVGGFMLFTFALRSDGAGTGFFRGERDFAGHGTRPGQLRHCQRDQRQQAQKRPDCAVSP